MQDNKEMNINSEKYELERKSVVVFVLNMFANFLGVIFQSLAGHVLDDSTVFADLNATLALINILILPTTISSCFVAKFVAEINTKDEKGKVKDFVLESAKVLVVCIVFLILFMFVFKETFSKWLYFENENIIEYAIILSGIMLFSSIFAGCLQGMQEFLLYGIWGLSVPTIKIIAVFCSAVAERKVVRILQVWIIGIIISYIIGCGLLHFILGKHRRIKNEISKEEKQRYIIKLFMANVGLILLNNMDILIIKNSFNEESGLYSAAMVLGKMIIYSSGAFVTVLFPMVASNKKNERSSIQLLGKSIFYNIIISLIIVIGILSFSEFFIRLLLGESYIECRSYLVGVCIYVIPLSIMGLIANYFMARDKMTFTTIILLLGIVCEFGGSRFFADSLSDFIAYIGGIMWIIVILNVLYIFKINKKLKNIVENK